MCGCYKHELSIFIPALIGLVYRKCIDGFCAPLQLYRFACLQAFCRYFSFTSPGINWIFIFIQTENWIVSMKCGKKQRQMIEICTKERTAAGKNILWINHCFEEKGFLVNWQRQKRSNGEEKNMTNETVNREIWNGYVCMDATHYGAWQWSIVRFDCCMQNETRFNSLEMELLVMDGWFMN